MQNRQISQLAACYPPALFETLYRVAAAANQELYLVGGAVRDWLLGGIPNDLDFTLQHGSRRFLLACRQALGKGTVVELGEEADDTCRLVLPELSIDVSGYRYGAVSLEEDLCRRDFTINSIGIDMTDIMVNRELKLIDPLGGRDDLHKAIIKACPRAFEDDPLRLMRAFRFAAQLAFSIEAATLKEITTRAHSAGRAAAERLGYELDLIVDSSRAGATVAEMGRCSLLSSVLPELAEATGVLQPAFHHLDVFEHSIEALRCLDQLIEKPSAAFPRCPDQFEQYLETGQNARMVKWATLLHDIGKPATRTKSSETDERITFYGHDRVGEQRVHDIGTRLRWSNAKTRRVQKLVAMHMHPFHLLNVKRAEGTISARALQKLCRKAGDELPALFLVAMADSMAGLGPDKPPDIERELTELYCCVDEMYREKVRPVLRGPKLLTGHDLIDTLGLVPGPSFKLLLEAVENAAIAGEIGSKEEALCWLRDHLLKDQPGPATG